MKDVYVPLTRAELIVDQRERAAQEVDELWKEVKKDHIPCDRETLDRIHDLKDFAQGKKGVKQPKYPVPEAKGLGLLDRPIITPGERRQFIVDEVADVIGDAQTQSRREGLIKIFEKRGYQIDGTTVSRGDETSLIRPISKRQNKQKKT